MIQQSATGRIVANIHRNPLTGGVESRSYEWHGGGIAKMDRSLAYEDGIDDVYEFERGSVFNLGPYRLRVLEVNGWDDCLIVMRDGWQARERWMRTATYEHLDLIYRRLILTAAVWGLTRPNLLSGELFRLPTWRDVLVLHRFARWFEAKSAGIRRSFDATQSHKARR